MAKDYIEDALKALNVGATNLDQKTVAQINSMNIELKNADGSLAGRYTLSSFLENIIYTFLSTTKASPLASVLGAVLGFTYKPATYTGYLNDMQPGFYYSILKSDEPNKPAEGGSSYWWCFCFGRGDGIQILLNNGSYASDAVLYLRRGSINTHIWKNWYKWKLESVI